MAFAEKTIKSETVYEGKIFRVRRDTVEAVNGKETYRDIVEHSGGSVLIPVKDNGKIIMVKQWRQALGRFVLELPAGKRDGDESYEETAARELREETGCTAGSMKKLITIASSVGYTDEELAIFYCSDLKGGHTDFDDTEDLDMYEYSPDELIEMIENGEIHDAKSVIGLLLAREEHLI